MIINLNKRTLGIAKSLAIIGSTGALVIGATFAATSVGTASLTSNTFSVGTGGVLIANDNSGSPGSFSTSVAGFNFGSLTQGGSSTTQHFWLKDGTTSAIALTMAAANVTTSNLDPTMVTVHVEKTGTTTDDSASLASLESGSQTLSNPPATADTNGVEYNVWITLGSSAVTTGNTASANFDLNFSATTTP
jgi:hypothetical protein